MDDLTNDSDITVPSQKLRQLIRFFALTLDFNEKEYLQKNTDIKAALAAREIDSAYEHFINNGFIEGREFFNSEVDEEWYQSEYPDVQEGIKRGIVQSSKEHYFLQGKSEGRFQNRGMKNALTLWSQTIKIENYE